MNQEVRVISRVKNGESQAEMDAQIAQHVEQGIALLYFNSQKTLNEWLARVQALSQ